MLYSIYWFAFTVLNFIVGFFFFWSDFVLCCIINHCLFSLDMWLLRVMAFKCKLQLHILQEKVRKPPGYCCVSCVAYFNPFLCVSSEFWIPELLLVNETGVFIPDRRGALLHVYVQNKIIPIPLRIAAAAPAVNMASALGRLARLSTSTTVRRSPSSSCGPGRAVVPCRTAVFTSSGAILPKPKKVSVGVDWEQRERAGVFPEGNRPTSRNSCWARYFYKSNVIVTSYFVILYK